MHAALRCLMLVLQAENAGDVGLHVGVQDLVRLEIALLESTKIVATVAAGILARPCDVTHDCGLNCVARG